MVASDGEDSPPNSYNAPAWMMRRAQENAAKRLKMTQLSPSNPTPDESATNKRGEAQEGPRASLSTQSAQSLPRVDNGRSIEQQVKVNKTVVKDTQITSRERREVPAESYGWPGGINRNNSSQAVYSSAASNAPKTAVATTTRNTTAPITTDPSHSRNSTLSLPRTKAYHASAVLPKWYVDIKVTSLPMVQISKRRPQALSGLEALKDCINRCDREARPDQLNALFEELRNHVHKADIVLDVNKFIIRKARILAPENGLPRIFNQDSKFPDDLKADSFQLYSRWLKEDFSQDILRGIITVKAKDRNGDRLDQAFRTKHPASAKFYGEGNFVLGQWWPTQLCTVRDGAHGATQGGISGERDRGAYSIVLSSGGYDDKDEGDVIEYSGTEGKAFKATEATRHMLKSAELGNDIRVIRSCQLQAKNPYRPQVGFRYDGLYKITSFKLVDEEKQNYRFRLERCSGQGPIRCQDNAAQRPTIFEIEQYKRMKEKVW